MTSSNHSSNNTSRVPTPNPRFTSQSSTAADLLASQTVGLVHLSDFRKRRAEALEQKEREAEASRGSFGRFAPASSASASASGAATPTSIIDGVSTPHGPPPKKKRKQLAKGKLSFGVDEEELRHGESKIASAAETPESFISTPDGETSVGASAAPSDNETPIEKRRLGPNSNLTVAPKAMTKSALLREAQTREQLRKEFLFMQEAVKGTEIIIPFVFYDGTNIPGGACKVKKGDYAWLFLDRSRKVGAELGIGSGEKAKSRNEWARVGVDDLMLVRGEIIIPHHYEFYYFIVNKCLGPKSTPLFDYAATTEPPRDRLFPGNMSDDYDPISVPSKTKQMSNGHVTPADRHLEGVNDDPNFTRVVDRRWYEKNKHIFPASVWEEFDPGKNYANDVRKDAEGNAFFFS